MPCATDCVSPSGFPIARTNCPTCNFEGIPKGCHRQLSLRRYLQDGQAIGSICPYELRRELCPVGEHHLDTLRASDDMLIGHDIPPLVYNDARANAALVLRRDIDLHHGWFDLRDHRLLRCLHCIRSGHSRGGCRARRTCPAKLPARKQANTEDDRQQQRQRCQHSCA